jgi:hypothetical protein
MSSFLCSGPGFGIAICANAAAANTSHVTEIVAMVFISRLANSLLIVNVG